MLQGSSKFQLEGMLQNKLWNIFETKFDLNELFGFFFRTDLNYDDLRVKDQMSMYEELKKKS